MSVEIIGSEGAPDEPGVTNRTWMRRGEDVMCTLCGLHIGKQDKTIKKAPVCKKCYKAYKKVKKEHTADYVPELMLRARVKLERYHQEQTTKEPEADPLLVHAEKYW